jgi:hypothetical protein
MTTREPPCNATEVADAIGNAGAPLKALYQR